MELEELLDRMEARLGEIEQLEESAQAIVFDLLDGVDALHRLALRHLADAVDAAQLERAREADPAVDWLLSAYGVGIDERAAAEAALESVRPFIHSHGGEVEVLDVDCGRVRVRMSGSCSGCSASAITLTQGVEEALRERFMGFVALDVEEDEAPSHAPPGETLVQLGRKTA